MTIRPLGDWVLIRRYDVQREGLLHLPATATDRAGRTLTQPAYGEVLAVGPGRRLTKGARKGERVPVSVQPGQAVVWPCMSGLSLETHGDGDEAIMLREDELLAVDPDPGDLSQFPTFHRRY